MREVRALTCAARLPSVKCLAAANAASIWLKRRSSALDTRRLIFIWTRCNVLASGIVPRSSRKEAKTTACKLSAELLRWPHAPDTAASLRQGDHHRRGLAMRLPVNYGDAVAYNNTTAPPRIAPPRPMASAARGCI